MADTAAQIGSFRALRFQKLFWEGGRRPPLSSPEGAPLERSGQSRGIVTAILLLRQVGRRGEGTTERPASLQGDASSPSPVADGSPPAVEGKAELIVEPISNMGQHSVTISRRELSARLKAQRLFDPDAVRARRPKHGRTACRTSSDTGARRGTVANSFTDNEEASP